MRSLPKRDFNLVLGLKLPKVDGPEALRQVKSDDKLKFDSGGGAHLFARGSGRLGLNSGVVKPIDFPEFVIAISELGAFWAVICAAPRGCVRK